MLHMCKHVADTCVAVVTALDKLQRKQQKDH